MRRNEAVYRLQKNRNPYVDYPQLAEHVWGNAVNEPFYSDAIADSFREIEQSPFERWLERIMDFVMTR